MPSTETLKDAAVVMHHIEIKALQLGAGIGLAVALPALTLAPGAVAPPSTPPLAAAASLAGVGAVTLGSFVSVAAAVRLSTFSSDAIATRASNLRSNPRQHTLDRVGVAGAAVGMLSAAAHMRVHPVPEGRAMVWQTVCFGLAGASVAVAGATLYKLAADRMCGVEDKAVAADASEALELAEDVEKGKKADAAPEEATGAVAQEPVKDAVEETPAVTPAPDETAVPNGDVEVAKTEADTPAS